MFYLNRHPNIDTLYAIDNQSSITIALYTLTLTNFC